METQTQVSSGAIVYRVTDDKIEFAIARLRDSIFVLPKGIVEKDESVEDAAIREVKEETNLQGKIITKLGVIDYWFVQEDVKIHKFVHFFLMQYEVGEAKAQAEELEEILWLKLDEALAKLKHKTEKQMLAQAIKAIITR